MNPMKFQPMLAATIKDVEKLRFPLIASPKLDGIRCTTIPAKAAKCTAVCRSLKVVPNIHIASTIARECPPGLDGELMVRGDDGLMLPFSSIQSSIMRHNWEPKFEFHVFDYIDRFQDDRFYRGVFTKYQDRLLQLASLDLPSFCKIVSWKCLENLTQLEFYENDMVGNGHEGVMLRSHHSPYKFGRSTFTEHWLLKLKRFADSEAVVIGYDERMSNQSPPKDDARGRLRRHVYKDCQVPTNSLGSLQVRDLKSGVEFSIGSGFSEIQRVDMWDARPTLIGKIATYKFQPHGVKEKPRMPIFKGFRISEDLL